MIWDRLKCQAREAADWLGTRILRELFYQVLREWGKFLGMVRKEKGGGGS